MGYLVLLLVAIVALCVSLARSPALRAHRRQKKAIGEDGLAHRQRHQDPRLP